MGKHKPIYDPSTDCGDYVVAVGCHDLHTTGKKRLQKKYYTHTTRPGSLKSMTMDKMFEKWGGGEVLKRAVRGMLPKNRLRDKRLARLKSKLSVHALIGDRPPLGHCEQTLTDCPSIRRPPPPLQKEHHQDRWHKRARTEPPARDQESLRKGQDDYRISLGFSMNLVSACHVHHKSFSFLTILFYFSGFFYSAWTEYLTFFLSSLLLWHLPVFYLSIRCLIHCTSGALK